MPGGIPWYTFPRVDNIGSPDPFGGFPKPDSNIQTPDNYPITALLSGVVSGINSPSGTIPTFGAVVTIKLDHALNSLATHTVYLHLASVAPGLHIGSHVNAGDLIGQSGGSAAAGSQKAPVGFALYSGDYYGYGSAWGNMTKANLLGPLNPVSLLNQIAQNGINSIQSTVGNLLSGLGVLNPASVQKGVLRGGLVVVGAVLVIVGLVVL